MIWMAALTSVGRTSGRSSTIMETTDVITFETTPTNAGAF
jgi:hypothetical protein